VGGEVGALMLVSAAGSSGCCRPLLLHGSKTSDTPTSPQQQQHQQVAGSAAHLDLAPAVEFEVRGLSRAQAPQQHVLFQGDALGVDKLWLWLWVAAIG